MAHFYLEYKHGYSSVFQDAAAVRFAQGMSATQTSIDSKSSVFWDVR